MSSLGLRTARALVSTSFIPIRCLRQQPLAASSLSLATRRWASAAAAVKPALPETPSAVEEDLATEEGDSKSPGQLFSSLKDKISLQTLKAVTIKPFQHTHMTSVQESVLELLPRLSDPAPENRQPGDPPRDVLVRAKTGTGKTLAFLVPAIEARMKSIKAAIDQAAVDSDNPNNDALKARVAARIGQEVGTVIISPTRELATQIATEAKKLSTHHDFGVQLFVGGVGKREQMYEWKRDRRDIVVGTPGRMLDLLNNEYGFKDSMNHAKILVLDEADTLLDMGFRDDIEQINSFLKSSPERQTFMFSATVSPAIRQIARSTLDKNHKFIDAVDKNTSPVHAHIPQYHTVLEPKDQLPHILRLIAHDQLSHPYNSKIILFLPTTKMTQLFADILRDLVSSLPARRETNIYEIHSQRTQQQRSNASDKFRSDTSGASILVTSDVSARGVDYPNTTRVIQLGIPSSPEQYVHRVGRTGRGSTKVSGRGDLVLLPWESGYISHNLREMPMKPVTVENLKQEVTKLAAAFDANPPSPPASPPRDPLNRNSRDRRNPFVREPRSISFRTPLSPHVSELDASIATYLPRLDSEAVDSTFTALAGYYSQNVSEMRVTRRVVIEGLKEWVTEACGMDQAPHLSDSFLKKIGMLDSGGGARDFGRGKNSYARSGGGGGGGYGRSTGREAYYGGGDGASRSSRSPFTDYSSRRENSSSDRSTRRPFTDRRENKDESGSDSGYAPRRFARSGGDRPPSGRGAGGYQRQESGSRQRYEN